MKEDPKLVEEVRDLIRFLSRDLEEYLATVRKNQPDFVRRSEKAKALVEDSLVGCMRKTLQEHHPNPPSVTNFLLQT